jgi:hypothetical protein
LRNTSTNADNNPGSVMIETTNSDPRPPKFGQEQPIAQHEKQQGDGDQTAPQVVENLPLDSTESGLAMRRASEPGPAAGAIA